MSRAVKLLGAGTLAGLMAAAIVAVGARTDVAPGRAGVRTAHPHHTNRAEIPDRCRTVTGRDRTCEAAWDTERRRFFGQTGR